MTAKTGQQLIANPIFDTLPTKPKSVPTTTVDESMQVDPSPANASAEKTASEDKATKTTAESGGKKYTPPVDAQTGDLILEATAYLRLLVALLSLDAGHNDQVSQGLMRRDLRDPGLDRSLTL